jgi:Mg2+/citrate symporter
MRIRRGVIAAGITIASIGASFATAGAASAVTVTYPTVIGVITGPHTFTIFPGEVVVPGETLHPNAPFYNVNVPVLAVTTSSKGVTTVTTGFTFLPLYLVGKTTTFTVVPPVP